MSLFSLVRRERAVTQIAAFEIQGLIVGFPISSVAARVPWSGRGRGVGSASQATGYTSHEGRLVPVYDVSESLGLPSRATGSEEVAIILTSQGFVAIQVDAFFEGQNMERSVKLLAPDDILDMSIRDGGALDF